MLWNEIYVPYHVTIIMTIWGNISVTRMIVLKYVNMVAVDFTHRQGRPKGT